MLWGWGPAEELPLVAVFQKLHPERIRGDGSSLGALQPAHPLEPSRLLLGMVVGIGSTFGVNWGEEGAAWNAANCGPL